jgi:uncharacterized membrane protein YtjA (UPF0391 family)
LGAQCLARPLGQSKAGSPAKRLRQSGWSTSANQQGGIRPRWLEFDQRPRANLNFFPADPTNRIDWPKTGDSPDRRSWRRALQTLSRWPNVPALPAGSPLATYSAAHQLRIAARGLHIKQATKSGLLCRNGAGAEFTPEVKENAMLYWAVVFLIVALVASLFGFFGVAGLAAGFAKILFVVFLVLFVVSLLFGMRRPVV